MDISSESMEWSYDPRQDVLSLPKGLAQALGLVQTHHMSLDEFLAHIHADDKKRLANSLKMATESDHPLDIDYRLIGADGAEIWVTQMGLSCNGQKNLFGTLRGIMRDITSIKRATAEASQANSRIALVEGEALEAKDSLQEFTYHTSHDLHAPLRSIIGFSELVMEGYSDKLDATGKDHLVRVVAQARRLEAMLDDLLSLSRVMAHPVNWQKIELSRLASEVARRKQKANPAASYKVEIVEGLTCQGDKELMETALDCLLDNAFKFSAGKKNAKIEFGKLSDDGEDQYFVRDNGVGFEMNYMDRLFRPFSRLHSSKDFSGNGIGLAIVASIVKKHGGRIWVESTPDKGTTFFFVLGKPPST